LQHLNFSTMALAVCLSAAPARGSTVLVTVVGVRNSHGHVRVAICSKADFLKPHCAYTGNAPSGPGDVQVTVTNVPPGTYAAQAFHDENDNERIDRNIFGIPTEGIGFSNNARMFFGPPRFDAAAFGVGAATLRITFSIRYF